MAETAVMLRADAIPARPVDSGLAGLVLLLRFHGVAATSDQIRHQFVEPGHPIDQMSMLRCAKSFDLKARAAKVTVERLSSTPLPALASLRDGGWVVMARAADLEVSAGFYEGEVRSV